ncbi:MAG: lecithin retinol acyltransferase family protein [Phycisphaerales bacterium]|nr:lecithin retinol acyltransferase family protein [Phycisphaerales bacterium]
MAKGDHIKVARRGYTHHGIDMGDGTVVEYDKFSGTIRRVDMAAFVGDAPEVRVVEHDDGFPPEKIADRAMLRMGESAYQLFSNNCEQFAYWCVTGRAASGQVRRVKAAALVMAAAGTAAVAGSILRKKRA